MNVIVSNKQKTTLDNASIDAIKDLTGLFNVDDLINQIKEYFFTKVIIDATAIVDFSKRPVLEKLVSGITGDKIILLLPPQPQPPKNFTDLLVKLGIYNYTTDINEVIKLLENPKTAKDYGLGDNNTDFYGNSSNGNTEQNMNGGMNIPAPNNNGPEIQDKNNDKKLVIGFQNVTEHAGTTTLIYMLKEQLIRNFNAKCEAFEIGKGDFQAFGSQGMVSINPQNLEVAIKNSQAEIILVDLNDNNYESLCDDVIFVIEPSIIKINKLLSKDRDIFRKLNNRKIILNKSMLASQDVGVFAKEANIRIYFNLPPLYERVNNSIIDDFIKLMGLSGKGRGLFGIF